MTLFVISNWACHAMPYGYGIILLAVLAEADCENHHQAKAEHQTQCG